MTEAYCVNIGWTWARRENISQLQLLSTDDLQERKMGELLGKLNASNPGVATTSKSVLDQASDIVHSATQTLGSALDAARQPGMPLDKIGGWTRQAPLRALAVAFFIGALTMRCR